MIKTGETSMIDRPEIRVHAITDDELRTLETRTSIARWLSLIASVLGAVIAIYAIFVQVGTRNASFEKELARDTPEVIQRLQADVRKIAQEQRQLRVSLEKSAADANTRLLDAKLDQISKRQERIEQVIMNSPQRALELPLLRNDLGSGPIERLALGAFD